MAKSNSSLRPTNCHQSLSTSKSNLFLGSIEETLKKQALSKSHLSVITCWQRLSLRKKAKRGKKGLKRAAFSEEMSPDYISLFSDPLRPSLLFLRHCSISSTSQHFFDISRVIVERKWGQSAPLSPSSLSLASESSGCFLDASSKRVFLKESLCKKVKSVDSSYDRGLRCPLTAIIYTSGRKKWPFLSPRHRDVGRVIEIYAHHLLPTRTGETKMSFFAIISAFCTSYGYTYYCHN